ncbi:structural protein [Synechococcus phage S-8S29]|nr:structural protein [Synechococcus phage S-8S29]
MANRIQLRRGGAQEWANANPTLAQGEIGIELDTTRIKIGDGVSAWNSLTYERPVESNTNTANTLVQRDADGNFSAGTITATLIGNASTATRLASTRQVSLSGDVVASETFDGSSNLNLEVQFDLQDQLPHYDGTTTSSGTYTKVTVDAKGRVIEAVNYTDNSNATLADYGLFGTNEGTGGDRSLASAQPYDNDLASLSALTTTGILSRSAPDTIVTRSISGTAGRIQVNDGGGINGNPTLDLIYTTVIPDPSTYTQGLYNTESLTSVSAVGANGEPFGTETVNAVKFTVDQWGRLTSATNVPIATATEGSKYASYGAGVTYARYDIIENDSKVYQALTAITAGSGAPTHTDSSDAGGWRYLAAAAVEQKGLASFAQEDFDVDSNGHVTIAALGVDNTQLQNNRISFADGNTKEDFELDQELTSTSGYRGFNYLNYVKVNDTSGNLLFGANNTGDSGAGEIDVNVRSYFSDPDITLDGAVAQTLDKSGDGNLTFSLTQNSASARNLSITSTNAGSGTSTVTISAEDVVDIDTTDANGKVHIEDLRIQSNFLASTGQLNLDPGDDRTASGLVRIYGDLQIDGTTTTVNSTELTVDDVTLLLGGDTAPASDDNLDRGVQFRYYDTQARLGFYGWDTNYTDLGGHEGGYRFLHAATNTSEVFSGTDSGIIAGNVKLTTNTNSTSNTTGDLVVAGGAGIGQDVNIGGLLDVDGTFRANSTSRFDDDLVLQGASKVLQLNNGSGTTRIELQSTTGNASFFGVVDITNDLNINTNKFNVASATGNTLIAGTLGVTGQTTVTGATDLNSTLNVAGLTYFESTDEPTITLNTNTGLYEIGSSDYGALRIDGGGYVEGEMLFNSDIYVNGQIVQKEDTTATYNRQNYLQVRYKLRTGTSAAYTPSYATHDTSNLRVYGGAGIATTLHVGGTGSGEGLFVGKEFSGNTVKFSVLGASGNTDIQGTLDVAGNSEFNGTVDVDADFAVRNGTTDKFTVDNVTGNTVIEGTLNGKGAADFDSTLNVDGNTTLVGTLTVTGTTEFNNTVDVDANFAVRSGSTDKFTVASASGNVATDGTLVVQGQTTINDSLIVDAANEEFAIQNGSGVDKFTVDSDNGNTIIVGTLTVNDPTQINDTLGVTGITTITRNTQQTLTGSYAADGAFRLTGGAGIGKNLAVGEGLRVYGATELTGALDLNNSADISGALVTHDDVTITADNKFFKIQTSGAVDKFTVDTDNGNTLISGTLGVTGDVTASSNLTVTGNLTVNGTTTTVNSTVVTLDDPVITLGGDTAPSSNDGKDRGVEFRYYDGTAKVGFFGYDRSSNQFTFITDATNSNEQFGGTDGNLRVGAITVTGSGTSFDVDSDANIDGTLTVDGQITSNVSVGAPFVVNSTAKVTNLNADLLDSMTTASAATVSTVVARDSSGDFAANQITAASGVGAAAGFLGNASSADILKTARTITVDGVVDGSVSFNGSADVTITTTYNDADITALAAMAGTGLVTRTAANTYAQRSVTATASSGITITNADGVAGDITINVASTSTNASNNLVLRDGSGNFAANVITADLTGDVTGNVTGNVTGTVSDVSNHTTDDIAEGVTNLYYTDARADARIAAASTDDLSEGSTNLYFTNTRAEASFDTKIAAATTDDLSEGAANLYYTDARADARIAAADTDALSEGSTNLYFTDARADARIAAATTDDLSEGSTNLYYTDTRADARVAAATGANLDLSSKTTTDLGEGTNLYYTEARVQDKLDNAFEQLRAMLNNLATTTTLVLNLSGDPTPGDVTALDNASLVAGTGYNSGTGVATTTSGSGVGLTVDVTASGGLVTAVAINAAGSGYAVGDTITISTGNADATIDVSAVVEMAVGDTVTGGTSGTTGVITAVGATSVTVDNVDGFFKKTETVSAGDVSTLTISSFA